MLDANEIKRKIFHNLALIYLLVYFALVFRMAEGEYKIVAERLQLLLKDVDLGQ